MLANVSLPNIRGGDMRTMVASVEALREELQFLLTHLSTNNFTELHGEKIVANSIIANKMDVQELSAIAANLGHITAGLIESVEIVGSLIRTATSGKRIELSSGDNLLFAENDDGNQMRINPDIGGTPGVEMTNTDGYAYIFLQGNDLNAFSDGTAYYGADGNVTLLSSSGITILNDWSRIYKYGTSRSLQDEFNDLSTRITALETAP